MGNKVDKVDYLWAKALRPHAQRPSLGRSLLFRVKLFCEEVPRFLARYPRLFLLLARARHGSGVGSGRKAIGKDTEIVIEGFPRSANSFSVAAFKLAQPQPVRVAHHLHFSGQVIAAAKMGIPALVLIREPEEAVLTGLSRMLELNFEYNVARQALREYSRYLRFYLPILPYRRYFVLARFESVTSEFDEVIRKVNDRFGTSFAEFSHTATNVERSFEAIGGYRPSEERNRIKDKLRDQLQEEEVVEAREKARSIYEVLASHADI
jgi:hypothetical protein